MWMTQMGVVDCRVVGAALSIYRDCTLKVVVDCPIDFTKTYTASYSPGDDTLLLRGGGIVYRASGLMGVVHQDIARDVINYLASLSCRSLTLIVTTVEEEERNRVLTKEEGEVEVYYPAVTVVELPPGDTELLLEALGGSGRSRRSSS